MIIIAVQGIRAPTCRHIHSAFTLQAGRYLSLLTILTRGSNKPNIPKCHTTGAKLKANLDTAVFHAYYGIDAKATGTYYVRLLRGSKRRRSCNACAPCTYPMPISRIGIGSLKGFPSVMYPADYLTRHGISSPLPPLYYPACRLQL